MRPLLFLSLLFLASSCGAKKTSSSYEMGKTTRADVIAVKGPPVSEVTNPVPDSTTIKYQNGESFQLKGDLVVNRFADPVAEEKTILWWKHKFKNCRTRTTQLELEPGSHTPPEIEFACPAEGMAVIYTQGSDSVSRVVQFEK